MMLKEGDGKVEVLESWTQTTQATNRFMKALWYCERPRSFKNSCLGLSSVRAWFLKITSSSQRRLTPNDAALDSEMVDGAGERPSAA